MASKILMILIITIGALGYLALTGTIFIFGMGANEAKKNHRIAAILVSLLMVGIFIVGTYGIFEYGWPL